MNFVIYTIYYVSEMWERRRGEHESHEEGTREKFVGKYLEYQLLGNEPLDKRAVVGDVVPWGQKVNHENS